MEKITVTLCANCSECASVEISGEGVRIGEDRNTVRLSHAEWNDLVARISHWRIKRGVTAARWADCYVRPSAICRLGHYLNPILA
jgi:hypothetical protein